MAQIENDLLHIFQQIKNMLNVETQIINNKNDLSTVKSQIQQLWKIIEQIIETWININLLMHKSNNITSAIFNCVVNYALQKIHLIHH